MALVSLQNVSFAFTGEKILDDLNLRIEKNQRVCLLGRNGAGKSTLMKLIHGELLPDSGTVQREPGLRTSYFTQTVPQDLEGSAFEIIAKGLGRRGELLLRFYREERRSSGDAGVLSALQEEMDALDGWTVQTEIDKILSLMSLDRDGEYRTLSGGQKRRVLLAAALISKPDLLLLDEPTNHLDINTIAWMEEFLLRLGVTLLFVTHDRTLLKRIATRIIELDRGRLVDWSCDYETFLKRKEAVLDAEEKEWERFDKKLAREQTWIRQGIKARRTRNEGRVRALMAMRDERRQRREREGTVSMTVSDAAPSGKRVVEATDISFDYGEKPLIQNFNIHVARGDKIGIIGTNGCGKTTLARILLGTLAPQSGTIRHGVNLAITYFDQLREQLDEERTVWENVLPNGGDMVSVDGRTRHIIAYLQDFLFTPERARTPVLHLSGGERNRLLLARLFTLPSNFLVLDEPTNDLDLETLELFEELLVNFKGTVLLISHDRAFLNNIVTSTVVFDDNGAICEYVGGYDDWLTQREDPAPQREAAPSTDKKKRYREEQKANRKKKLSFKEAKELQELPARIETLEEEEKALYRQMEDTAIYREWDKVLGTQARLKELEKELAQSYERWEYLEELKGRE